MENIEIASFKSRAISLSERSDSLIKRLEKQSKTKSVSELADYGLSKSVRSLVGDYNSFRKKINRFLREGNISEEALLEKVSSPSKSTSSKVYFDVGITRARQVKDNCNTAEGILRKMEELTLSEEEEKELRRVEEKIEEMKKSNLNSKYVEDLERSLREFRSGHLLASALVTGRVLDVVLDKIESKIGSKNISKKISQREGKNT